MPTDRKAIVRILCDGFVLRTENDVTGMLRYAADDAVYRGNGWKNFRNATVRGKEALAQMLWSIFIEYEALGSTLRETVFDADAVAFLRTVTLRKRGSGKAADVDICAFIRLRGGLIVEFEEKFDTEKMLELDS